MDASAGTADVGLKRRALAGFLWSYGGYIGGRVAIFATTLILARVLAPEDFGLIAFALAVLAYADAMKDVGVGEALVYRSDARDPSVASTAYWIAVGTGTFLVAATWLAAPLLDSFGPDGDLVWIFRVLSLQILVGALTSTHRALLRHDLAFRRLFVPDVLSAAVKAIVSVALALGGAGVWSLVWGQLASSLAGGIALWVVSGWRPSLSLRRPEIRSLTGYGSAITGIGLLSQAIHNVDYLFIGAQLGAGALGFYWIAFRLPELGVLAIFRVAYRVLFPFYARLQDGGEALPEPSARDLAPGYLQTVRLASLVAFPLGFVLAAVALPLTLVLFGERWEESAAPFAFLSIWAAIWSVTGLSGTVFKAMGRPGLLTVTALIYLVLLVPTLWFAAGIDIVAVAIAHVIVQTVYFLISGVITARVLGFALPRLLAKILPALVASLVAGAAAYLVAEALPPLAGVAAGLAVGALAYMAVLRLLFGEDLHLIASVVREARARGRRKIESD